MSYLLARDASAAVEAEFLRSFATGFLTLADLTVPDLDRSAGLVGQYADLSLGATDACLIALAERLGIVELADVVLELVSEAVARERDQCPGGVPW